MANSRRTEVPPGQPAETLPSLLKVLVHKGTLGPEHVHGRVSGEEGASMGEKGQLALAVAGGFLQAVGRKHRLPVLYSTFDLRRWDLIGDSPGVGSVRDSIKGPGVRV